VTPRIIVSVLLATPLIAACSDRELSELGGDPDDSRTQPPAVSACNDVPLLGASPQELTALAPRVDAVLARAAQLQRQSLDDIDALLEITGSDDVEPGLWTDITDPILAKIERATTSFSIRTLPTECTESRAAAAEAVAHCIAPVEVTRCLGQCTSCDDPTMPATARCTADARCTDACFGSAIPSEPTTDTCVALALAASAHARRCEPTMFAVEYEPAPDLDAAERAAFQRWLDDGLLPILGRFASIEVEQRAHAELWGRWGISAQHALTEAVDGSSACAVAETPHPFIEQWFEAIYALEYSGGLPFAGLAAELGIEPCVPEPGNVKGVCPAPTEERWLSFDSATPPSLIATDWAWNAEDGSAAPGCLRSTGSGSEVHLALVSRGGTVTFAHREDSEACCDRLEVALDGRVERTWSGQSQWRDGTVEVPPGRHTITWSYVKDGAVDVGGDAVFLDDVRLLGVAAP